MSSNCSLGRAPNQTLYRDFDSCPSAAQPCRDLLAVFADLPEPRRPRGVRHAVCAILAMAGLAVLGGARSFTAIGEWAADAPQWLLELLRARLDAVTGRFVAPHEATLRRTIQGLRHRQARQGDPRLAVRGRCPGNDAGVGGGRQDGAGCPTKRWLPGPAVRRASHDTGVVLA
jgi:hypothetical protein